MSQIIVGYNYIFSIHLYVHYVDGIFVWIISDGVQSTKYKKYRALRKVVLILQYLIQFCNNIEIIFCLKYRGLSGYYFSPLSYLAWTIVSPVYPLLVEMVVGFTAPSACTGLDFVGEVVSPI